MNENGLDENMGCFIEECIVSDDETSMDKYVIEELIEYTDGKRGKQPNTGEDQKILECVICTRVYTTKQYLINHTRRKNHFIGNTVSQDIDAVLPKMYKYYVVFFKEIDHMYEIKLCIPLMMSKEELRLWVRQYTDTTNQTYVTRTVQSTPKGTRLFEQWYNCHHYHSLAKRKLRTKGSDCKSSIFVSVSQYGHTNIHIKVMHNHPVSEYALRYGQPDKTVRFVYRNLFNNGLGPTAALQSFKNHIYLQSPDQETYLLNISDRKTCPDLQWVYYYFKGHTRCAEQGEMKKNLRTFIQKYNDKQKQTVCLLKNLTNDDFVASIVTPFMLRVCEMNTAGELVLIDSTGIIDRFGLYVFPILTISTAGRLPIGLVITTKRKEFLIREGFNLYVSMLNEKSFGGRGKEGPSIVMTDATGTEITALKSVFPNAKMLLCVFHVLQTVFRWILKANEISESREKWQAIYSDVKRMVYSTDKKEIDNIHERLQRSLKGFPSLSRYITRLYEGREHWAISYQIGNQTVRYIKDNICPEIVANDLSQFFEYLLVRYEKQYIIKIMNIVMDKDVNEETKSLLNSEKYEMMPYSDDTVTAHNKENNIYYVIYNDIGYCTCYTGVTGRYCKHQMLWAEKSKTFSPNTVFANTTEQKVELFYIATGCVDIPKGLVKNFKTTKCSVAAHVSADEMSESGVPVKNNKLTELYLDSIAEVEKKEVESIIVEDDATIEEVQREFMCAMEALLNIVDADIPFYQDAMQSMSEEIEKLQMSSKDKLIIALQNFNKNGIAFSDI